MAKRILSIRVEDKTTLIVHMDYSSNLPTVYGCLRIPTPQGAVEDGVIIDATALARRIKKACGEKGIHTRDVVFTLGSSKIANREVSIPVVSKNKIQSLVEAKANEYFPVDTSKYCFAYSLQGRKSVDQQDEQSNDPNTGNAVSKAKEEGGKTMDLLVFAAPESLLQSYYGLADTLGYHVVAIDTVGNSAFQLMRRQVKKGVVMSVQIDRLNTMINVMSGEELLLQRTVGYGISNVTDAMINEKAFQVKNYDNAYDLLCTRQVLVQSFERVAVGMDMSHQKRLEVTETLSPLVGNVSRIIEYYNSKYRDNPITEIICTGVGAGAVGVQELLNNELGIRTYTPQSITGVKFAKKVELTRSMLQYVGCFGATLDPVRFVTKAEIAKDEARSSNAAMALIIAAGILVSLVLSGVSVLMLLTTKAEEEAATLKVQTMQSVQNRYLSMSQKQQDYEKYNTMRGYVDNANNCLRDLIIEFNKHLPKNAVISSMITTTKGVTLNVEMADKLSAVSSYADELQKLKNTKDGEKYVKYVEVGSISRTAASTAVTSYQFPVEFTYSKEVKVDDTSKKSDAVATTKTEKK